MVFDRVYSGPRVRQLNTASIVSDAYQKVGLEFPVPVVMNEFDEYEGEVVLRQSLARLLEESSEIRFCGDPFTLSTLNAFPHLDDAALLTYR